MAVTELRRHYQDVRARLNSGAKPPEPAPVVQVPVDPNAPIFYYHGTPIYRDTDLSFIVENSEIPGSISRQGEPSQPSISRITGTVCTHFNIRRTEIVSHRRNQKLVFARQLAIYLCRILTSRSLPEIGRRFGGRDHSTVWHSIKKIEGLRETDPETANLCAELEWRCAK